MTKRYSDKPAVVSRFLGKVFTRSESSASMVIGYPSVSTGFEVERLGDTTHVYHRYPLSYRNAKPLPELEKYKALLESKGYEVTLDKDRPRLVVEGLKTYYVVVIACGKDNHDRWGQSFTVEDPEEAVRRLVRKEFGPKAFLHVESTRSDLSYLKLQYGQVFKDLPKGGSTSVTGRVRVEVSYD
jgi:hypothetical protein